MKKQLYKSAMIVLASIGLMAVNASAYSFEDMIDTWNILGVTVDARPIMEGVPFTYTHDINDSVNLAAGDYITEAYLELDFTNDLNDSFGSLRSIFGTIKWDFREYATVGFNGSNWVSIGEVDNDQYEVILNIDWLNDDGQLDVTINISNPTKGIAALAFLDHSRLYGTAQAAPVPEPAAMLLFGIGLTGLAAFTRRNAR